jgi:hypothetical protein
VPSEGLWGVALGLYPDEAARRGLPHPPSAAPVAALGANAVLLPVSWSQQDVEAVDLAPDTETVRDRDLLAVAADARARDLAVALLPTVRLRRGRPTDWRGRLRPRDPDRWWRSYERFIVRYARLAAEMDASVLAIGSELTSMSADRHRRRWNRLAARARRAFAGKLAFVVNHDALDRTAPVAFVDILGVSAYVPLASDPDAPPAALARRFHRYAARLSRLRRRLGKPLVLFEVGYPSIDGGATAPWDYTTGAPVDLEEQASAYRAVARAMESFPSLDGLFAWIWFGPGGPFDRYYTPRGKPAEAILESLLRDRTGRAVAAAQPGSGVD